MINYIFNNDFINDLKKNVINFISRTNINVNKITFNLSLYTQFVISDDDELYITPKHPTIINGKITPATIKLGGGYFDKMDNDFYIKPEYEDDLIFKITKLLVRGAALRVEYSGTIPISISGTGFIGNESNAFDNAFSSLITEDINNYSSPDFEDPHSFNKGVMRMILAITGYKPAINSYFNHDKSLSIALYSLSVDSNIFVKIYDRMNSIDRLINTRNNKFAIKNELQKSSIDNLLQLRKEDLLNLIINKLYIPYINSVPFDKRRKVRDEILKGFLGVNFANLKINDLNKDNYYYASLINNTVPINNKITEQSWSYFRKEVEEKYNNKLSDIHAENTITNIKNGTKEFLVEVNNGKISINTNKKTITEKKLVIEMLSFAYLSTITPEFKGKLENGVIALCSTKKMFKVALKGNLLDNKMLIATVIQLAAKNGFNIEIEDVSNNVAYFKIKEPV